MIEDSQTDFHTITDFGLLYKAYHKSKRGNGYKKSKQKFNAVALDGIYQIKQELISNTYRPTVAGGFLIKDPKERYIEIYSFKDKIVQHSICDNVLLPILSNEFIKNNFAGQLGKGTLFGLDQLRDDMLTAYKKYGMNCWILKGDISKYFYNISHAQLYDIIGYHVEDKNIYELCTKFINDKNDVGIPLGNQISQVFALLYLSGMDYMIMSELGIEFYGRCMDDFYLIAPSKSYLKECLTAIELFTESLGLKLNGKTQIIPFKNGIKFCGFHTYVTKDGKVIRKLPNEKKRAKQKQYRRMAKLVKAGKLSKEKFYESYNSWKNHLSHGNCVKLQYEMDKYIEEIMI